MTLLQQMTFMIKQVLIFLWALKRWSIYHMEPKKNIMQMSGDVMKIHHAVESLRILECMQNMINIL